MERNDSNRSIGDWMTLLVGDRPLSQEEIEQFQRWLKRDPERLGQLRNHAGSYRAMRRLLSHPGLSEELDRFAPPSVWRIWWERIIDQRPWLAAASLLFAVVAGLYAFFPADSELVQTGAGEQLHLELADGSVVELNENSRLRIDFTPQTRQVILEQGEGYFRVTPNPQRPFRVETTQGDVQVLGTSFNVALHAHGVEVGVLEGVVQVVGSNTRFARSYELRRGDLLSLQSGGETATLHDALGETADDWRPWRLEFQNLQLSDLVEQLNESSDRKWSLYDPALGVQRVSGSLRIADEAGIRFLLQQSFGLAAVDEGERIVLHRDSSSRD